MPTPKTLLDDLASAITDAHRSMVSSDRTVEREYWRGKRQGLCESEALLKNLLATRRGISELLTLIEMATFALDKALSSTVEKELLWCPSCRLYFPVEAESCGKCHSHRLYPLRRALTDVTTVLDQEDLYQIAWVGDVDRLVERIRRYPDAYPSNLDLARYRDIFGTARGVQ